MNLLKKYWYVVLAVLMMLTPVVMVGYISIAYRYSVADAWVAFKTMGEENTKFQHLKFTEANFAKITPGMRGSEVFELLGLPLERQQEDTIWRYSVPVDGAKYYHERVIRMEKGTGKVAEVLAQYHTPE